MKATAALKINAEKLDFINRLSDFINASWGSTKWGFSKYYALMMLDTIGKLDSSKKVAGIRLLFEAYAHNLLRIIAEKTVPQ
jgi:hypothetical protein